MNTLKEMIVKHGRVLPGNILKVDSFINHQIDANLMMELGEDFYNHFKDKKITKVLTLEVSGIAIALTTALKFNVPLVFAKKIESRTLDEDVWESKVYSYTKDMEYKIRVSKNFLTSDDKVLIIDDFLANGQALSGIVDLCNQSGAAVQGIGITIEKSFQSGGKEFRKKGYDVYSQAKIKEFRDDEVIFE